MSIRSIHLNVDDIERSVNFYTRLLDLQVVGTPDPDSAVLDAVTATLQLHRIDGQFGLP